LYNDWTQRNKTLVTKDSLLKDLRVAERSAKAAGVSSVTKYFIPPYEWWNTEVAGWLDSAGYKTFSFTPGTTSNADYTWPDMGKSYRSSDEILSAIKKYDQQRPGHLNGVVLLIHIGTDPRRTDKLYNRLPELIAYLRQQGYVFKKAGELLRYR
jgi:peptidoglycan/xylan/chitin deacetylase (PgdA/CDA1 family)